MYARNRLTILTQAFAIAAKAHFVGVAADTGTTGTIPAVRVKNGWNQRQRRRWAMNILEIVKDWLEQNGYDGLCDPEMPCGCMLNDLMPCGTCNVSLLFCVAGHRVDNEGSWLVFQGKAPQPDAAGESEVKG